MAVPRGFAMSNLFLRFFRDTNGSMIADVAKASGIIALLSVVAANVVSTQTANLDREQLSRVASAATRGPVYDPLVTGSLAKRAGETRLDPCVVQR